MNVPIAVAIAMLGVGFALGHLHAAIAHIIEEKKN